MNDIKFYPKIFAALCMCKREMGFTKNFGEFPGLVECSGCSQIWSLNWYSSEPTAYPVINPLAIEKLKQTQTIIKG